MKYLKFIVFTLTLALAASVASAQVVKKDGQDRASKKDDNSPAGTKVSGRQQAFYEQSEPSDADKQWEKVVYRVLDLNKDRNQALYYPEEPNEDGQNLFYIIMRLLANNKISVYEYLNGREIFTDAYKYDVKKIFERFHMLYTEAKGSTEKNPIYELDDSDIPGNEILSYYIIEKYTFDTRTNVMRSRVEAICPVLHRMDDYGGILKFPMFWVLLNDIRPYIAQQYVFTDDDNNLMRYNLDDFFNHKMYEGDIFKVKNRMNKSLMQLFPDSAALAHARDSIEQRLHRFDKDLWVPTREELQAQAEAKRKLEAEKNGETPESDQENATNDKGTTSTQDKKSSARSTKRGSNNDDNKKNKKKVSKPKEVKSNQGVGRSVRNRKR